MERRRPLELHRFASIPGRGDHLVEVREQRRVEARRKFVRVGGVDRLGHADGGGHAARNNPMRHRVQIVRGARADAAVQRDQPRIEQRGDADELVQLHNQRAHRLEIVVPVSEHRELQLWNAGGRRAVAVEVDDVRLVGGERVVEIGEGIGNRRDLRDPGQIVRDDFLLDGVEERLFADQDHELDLEAVAARTEDGGAQALPLTRGRHAQGREQRHDPQRRLEFALGQEPIDLGVGHSRHRPAAVEGKELPVRIAQGFPGEAFGGFGLEIEVERLLAGRLNVLQRIDRLFDCFVLPDLLVDGAAVVHDRACRRPGQHAVRIAVEQKGNARAGEHRRRLEKSDRDGIVAARFDGHDGSHRPPPGRELAATRAITLRISFSVLSRLAAARSCTSLARLRSVVAGRSFWTRTSHCST